MIIKEIQSKEKAIWDSFVSTHPQGHLLQSYAWGEVKAKSGWLPIRLIVEDQGKTKAAIQILKRKVPLTGKCIFLAPRGPVMNYSDHETFDFLLTKVREIAREHAAIFFMIDPAVSDEDIALKEYLRRQEFEFSDEYGIIGLTLPKRVFHLDLTPTENAIMANMSQTHRRYIRRSQKNGVTIERHSNEKGLETFYRLYKEMSKRKKFPIRSFYYQKALLETFQPDNHFELFLAKHNGNTVAGRLILQYGNKAWDMYAMSEKSDTQLKASYCLVWEVLKAMKAKGCTLFDFRGADSKDPQSPLYGVHMFKKGFGPTYVEYIGEYYYICAHFYFKVFNGMRFIVKHMLKVYKRIRVVSLFAVIKKNFLKITNENLLKNTILEKYGQKEELEAHSQTLKMGLLDAEDRSVNKYFKQGDSVLNIGCGGGREAIALIKKGFQVTGTDLHPKMVERSIQNAKEYGVEGCFEVMDACQMTFKDSHFDQVVMFGSVITHIPKRANRIIALKEVKRVLKTGGHIILSVPNRKAHIKYLLYFLVMNIWRRMCMCLIKDYSLEPNDRFGKTVSSGKSVGKVYFHMYALGEMMEDIKCAGLTVVDCRSNRELMMNIDSPHDREKDYFLYFIVKKED